MSTKPWIAYREGCIWFCRLDKVINKNMQTGDTIDVFISRLTTGKNEKIYSLHVSAIKFIWKKELV